VALTVVALRPDLFRIVIDSPTESSPVQTVATGDAFDETTASAGTVSSAGEVSVAKEAPISFSTS